MLRSGAEVVGVELVGGTDLGAGGWSAAATEGASTGRGGAREGEIHPASRGAQWGSVGEGGIHPVCRGAQRANVAERAGDADGATRARFVLRVGDAGGVCLDRRMTEQEHYRFLNKKKGKMTCVHTKVVKHCTWR
jgi:hypothetical protein